MHIPAVCVGPFDLDIKGIDAMSNRGGYRPNAGRKKGSVASHRKLANEATVRAIGEGMTPLEYLLNIMRNVTEDADRRLDAAKAAAPYVHPRLSSLAVEKDPGNRAITELSDEELYAMLGHLKEIVGTDDDEQQTSH
ncbi:MAG: hypothetical protein CTY28_11325 [Hyphomicrobium sp.]|nr:MAG: hypothetical protein CTY28_11325 [Hyphomicrobium sp.]